MNDRHALYRAVLDNPADDAPRLAFANWLESNGCADGAEFVRLQLRLARDPSSHGPGCREEDPCPLCCRLPDLLGPENPWWWEGLPGTAGETWQTPTLVVERVVGPGRFEASMLFAVERGFVAAVECDRADWLAHGPGIMAGHPVESVNLGAEPMRAAKPRAGWVWTPDHADLDEPHYAPREWAGGLARSFGTRSAARNAYNAAALAWAGAESRLADATPDAVRSATTPA